MNRLQEAKDKFEAQGYELLDTEFKGAMQKHKFVDRDGMRWVDQYEINDLATNITNKINSIGNLKDGNNKYVYQFIKFYSDIINHQNK